MRHLRHVRDAEEILRVDADEGVRQVNGSRCLVERSC